MIDTKRGGVRLSEDKCGQASMRRSSEDNCGQVRKSEAK